MKYQKILSSHKFLGRSVLSQEVLPLVKGEAEFTDDISYPDMLFAKFVRSPYAHAKIKSIKGKGALRLFTWKDIADHVRLPKPVIGPFVKRLPLQILAADKVRFVGEPVAVVLADNRYAAEDALDDVEVDYEPLPTVVDADESLKDLVVINEEWGTNTALHAKFGTKDFQNSIASADIVIEENLRVQRVIAASMEMRAVLSNYDRGTKVLNVWESTQSPFQERSALSQYLGIDENKIKVVACRCGGAFGSKSALPYSEYILVPLLSMLLGKPVKWIEDRSESFIATSHGREQTHVAKLYAMKDGTILGLEDRIVVDIGAYPARSSFTEALGASLLLQGCYDIKNSNIEVFGVTTNKVPIGPYRGFGKTAPTFVIERMVDRLSKALSLDPSDVRQKNFIKSFPHVSTSGIRYDSGDYGSLLSRALKAIEYDKLREEIVHLRASGVYRGIGFSSSISPSGGVIKDTIVSPYDGVNIKICKDGSILVSTGACGLIGTEHQSSLAQVVAEVLGANLNQISVFEGDTLACPVGQGSYSDRSAVYTVSAAHKASLLLKENILDISSQILKAKKEDLAISDHRVSARGNDASSISFGDIARTVYNSPYSLHEINVGDLDVTYYFGISDVQFAADGITYFPCIGSACHVCYVEVDPESGSLKVLKYLIVDDCGFVINPAVVEGQLIGGIMQGVSGAILEDLNYDSSGQLVNTSFIDYMIATSTDSFQVSTESLETRSDMTLLGTKGVGESGTIGSYAAVASAVEDALSPFGAKITRLPLSPEYLLSKIKAR